MSRFSANASLLVLLFLLPGGSTAAQPASESGGDACLAVASAKFEQWAQERMMIDETNSFADGTSKTLEAIFTADESYARRTGSPWIALDRSRGQRAAPPAAMLVRRMGLTGCAFVGSEAEAHGTASHYTFGYLPDMNARDAKGEIWISDSSHLPLRQDLHQDEPTPNARVPQTISARFTYGTDVEVPKAATREEVYNRWLGQQFWFGENNVMIGMASPSGGGGGEIGGVRHR